MVSTPYAILIAIDKIPPIGLVDKILSTLPFSQQLRDGARRSSPMTGLRGRKHVPDILYFLIVNVALLY